MQISSRRYPSQILCLAEQVNFTRRCERAVESGELDLLRAELMSQLQAYVIDTLAFGQRLLPRMLSFIRSYLEDNVCFLECSHS